MYDCLLFFCGDWNQGETEFSLAAEFSVDFKFGVEEEKRTTSCNELRMDLTEVSRLYRVLESDLVDSCVQGHVARDVVFYGNCATLGHDFAENHSRNYGIARKVPPGEELVFLDAVCGICLSLREDFGMLNQKHGLPVGHE